MFVILLSIDRQFRQLQTWPNRKTKHTPHRDGYRSNMSEVDKPWCQLQLNKTKIRRITCPNGLCHVIPQHLYFRMVGTTSPRHRPQNWDKLRFIKKNSRKKFFFNFFMFNRSYWVTSPIHQYFLVFLRFLGEDKKFKKLQHCLMVKSVQTQRAAVQWRQFTRFFTLPAHKAARVRMCTRRPDWSVARLWLNELVAGSDPVACLFIYFLFIYFNILSV